MTMASGGRDGENIQEAKLTRPLGSEEVKTYVTQVLVCVSGDAAHQGSCGYIDMKLAVLGGKCPKFSLENMWILVWVFMSEYHIAFIFRAGIIPIMIQVLLLRYSFGRVSSQGFLRY